MRGCVALDQNQGVEQTLATGASYTAEAFIEASRAGEKVNDGNGHVLWLMLESTICPNERGSHSNGAVSRPRGAGSRAPGIGGAMPGP